MDPILLLVAAVACAGATAGADPSPAPQTAQAAGVRATWEVRGTALIITATAPTSGWVLVGLHDRQALAGARLAMGAVTDAGPVVEEHVADPPRHAARTTGQRASLVSAMQAAGTTTVTFEVPLDPGDASLPTLHPGARTWMWLAWSHEEDFQHHSAQREGVWVVL